jgi:hypothetical protein
VPEPFFSGLSFKRGFKRGFKGAGRRVILTANTMKAGFVPLLLSLAALAGCARGNPAQGVGINPEAGGPSAHSAPSAQVSQGVSPTVRPTVRQGSPDSRCPSETPLDPGPDANAAATAAATEAVPQRYPPHIDVTGFRVTDAYAADPSWSYGAIAYGLCGDVVGHRTWVVELSFPKMAPSVNLSAGQLFVSRFPEGWKVWFQYH